MYTKVTGAVAPPNVTPVVVARSVPVMLTRTPPARMLVVGVKPVAVGGAT
jgi:hypothetical protein